jgi:hypothetical protein
MLTDTFRGAHHAECELRALATVRQTESMRMGHMNMAGGLQRRMEASHK